MINRRRKPFLALWYFLALWLCLWGSSASAQACGDDKPIRLADLSWESAAFSTELYQQILEKAYGCKTERVPGSSAAFGKCAGAK